MAETRKGTLAEALVTAQAEMPKVEKRGRNPHFKSAYVTLDDLIDAVRPVLNRHGLAVVQFPSEVDGHAALQTTIYHGASGETVSSKMILLLQKDKNDMQALGAAITYARRYMLAAALGIAEGTDDDGNHASSRDRGDYMPPTRVEPQAKRPESWSQLAAGFDALEVDPVWLQQAVRAYLGKDTAELDPKEKELAFQLLASVLMRLQDGEAGLPETVGGYSREQLQKTFAQLLEGKVLEGPPWRIAMETADSERPSKAEWDEAQKVPGEDPSIELGKPSQ